MGPGRATAAAMAAAGLLICTALVAGAGGNIGTLTVVPTSVFAGDTVQASGTCPSGLGVFLSANLVVGSSPEADEGFDAWLRPDPDTEGNWFADFRVPRETWQFSLTCTDLDVAYPGPDTEVDVTSDDPVELTFGADREPLVAGKTTTVSGSGCIADGRALGVAHVSVFRQDDTGEAGIGHRSVTPSASGEFIADLPIPADTPSGLAMIQVQCDDVAGQSPSFGRLARIDTEIRAAPPPASPPTPPALPIPARPTFTG